ncbi:MAG: hypothetical protein ACLGI7_01935 [Gammaproteobacteria bacterium]
MAARRCSVCGEDSVRRVRRRGWRRLTSYLVPLGPRRCLLCGAHSCGVLHGEHAVLPWVSSTPIWSLLLVWSYAALR